MSTRLRDAELERQVALDAAAITGTLTQCGHFGISSASHWTGAANIVQEVS
jgi:hypothetical protein